MLFQLSQACGTDPSYVCKSVYDATGSEFWARATEWLVDKPIKALIILVAAWLVRRLAHKAIRSFIARSTERIDDTARQLAAEEASLGGVGERLAKKLDAFAGQGERKRQRTKTFGTVLESLATAVIYTFGVLIALGEFDINLGPLIAGAGIVGVALGFGAQTVVRDFLAGTFMLLEDQYGVGDIIDFGDATGIVEAASLRTTQVRDVEGTVWFVPNGEIKRIGNKSQLWARAVMDIEVAYSTDLAAAAAVIKRVADEVWHDQLDNATIIEEPEIWGVQDFGASAIAIRLVIKTEPGEQFNAAREIRGRLKAAFDEAGIEIPFPQRTVWLQRDPVAGVPTSVLHAAGPANPEK
jgi:small conductance mechanosensitive channel